MILIHARMRARRILNDIRRAQEDGASAGRAMQSRTCPYSTAAEPYIADAWYRGFDAERNKHQTEDAA